MDIATKNLVYIVDDDPGRYVSARELENHLGKEVTVLGYLICTKDAYTSKREHMQFGTFLDAKGDWIDTVHFPDTNTRYPLHGKGFYRMRGKVTEEFGVFTVEVNHVTAIGIRSHETQPAPLRI